MATTIMGCDMLLFLDSTTSVKPVAFATDTKLEADVNMEDLSTKDTGSWETAIPTKFKWSASSDNLVCFDVETGAQDTDVIYGLFKDGTKVNVAIAIKNGTAPGWTIKTGTKKFSGSGYINKFSLSASKDGFATYSISIKGDGELQLVDVTA